MNKHHTKALVIIMPMELLIIYRTRSKGLKKCKTLNNDHVTASELSMATASSELMETVSSSSSLTGE